jgi:hypothetical protein
LLFALISGGALSIAFIPVLSESLSKDGRSPAASPSSSPSSPTGWCAPSWAWHRASLPSCSPSSSSSCAWT